MSNKQITGYVRSGEQALDNANVKIYEANDNGYTVIGSARTDGDGKFICTPIMSETNAIFYALAYPSSLSTMVLAAVIGPVLADEIVINELTTVAAAYSMAQFTSNGMISGSGMSGDVNFALRLAWGMNNNLVDLRTGDASSVLQSSPNGDETNSLRSLRALGNLLAACVPEQRSAIDMLFALTTPAYSQPPSNTFQALVNIVLNPGNNVTALFNQAKVKKIYKPALVYQPNAWTLAVKVNIAGYQSDGTPVPFGGPANIAFDQNGYAWIANNVDQGQPTSGKFIVVLQPNGKPADGSNGSPTSPVTGGGILGPGFGIGIDNNHNIWVGNFGWGGEAYQPSPDGNGSVSQFYPSGQPISGDQGYQGGTDRVQGLAVDEDNNIWFASFGNDSIVVFEDGNPMNPLPPFVLPKGKGPFGVAIIPGEGAWVSNSGGLWEGASGSIGKYRLETDENNNKIIVQTFFKELGHSLKGLALDSGGKLWVASGGDNAVYLLDTDGKVLGKYGNGGINAPWGVVVDGDDHVWVANFGPMLPGNVFTTASISKLAGANPNTLPYGVNTGDPLSPQTGYTLPTGGSEVMLPGPGNEPLYGCGGEKCYNPLMRLTNCVIDQAGNVWAINNWKPDFNVDVQGNPGGDGIVIFVGLARPPKPRNKSER